MAEDTTTPATSRLAIIREIVAGVIAVFVLWLFVMLLRETLSKTQATADYQAAKDLLMMVNPLLGLVVGYYFSRVTTEARAERAEATVATTTRSAQQATEARTAAEHHARAAADQVLDFRQALEGLAEATERARGAGTLALETAQTEPAGRSVSLDLALERARRVLDRAS